MLCCVLHGFIMRQKILTEDVFEMKSILGRNQHLARMKNQFECVANLLMTKLLQMRKDEKCYRENGTKKTTKEIEKRTRHRSCVQRRCNYVILIIALNNNE